MLSCGSGCYASQACAVSNLVHIWQLSSAIDLASIAGKLSPPTGCQADRVLFDSDADGGNTASGTAPGCCSPLRRYKAGNDGTLTSSAAPRRVTGLLASATVDGHALRLRITSPLVVSSAGAIHTPALLLRSGVKAGGAVGSNLRLHPVCAVFGVFPDDPEKKSMMEGAAMTAYTSQLANWGAEGSKYGPLVFTPMVRLESCNRPFSRFPEL